MPVFLVCLAVAGLFLFAVVFVGAFAERARLPRATGMRNSLPVFSPLRGIALPLSEECEFTLADGREGHGLAIRPLCEDLLAPFDATVVAVNPASRTVVLRHRGGVEVLINIAVNTESLDGDYFTPKVVCGQQVEAGSLLAEFDHAAVKAAGHDAIASVIVLNVDLYPHVVPLADGAVLHGEALFMAEAVEHR